MCSSDLVNVAVLPRGGCGNKVPLLPPAYVLTHVGQSVLLFGTFVGMCNDIDIQAQWGLDGYYTCIAEVQVVPATQVIEEKIIRQGGIAQCAIRNGLYTYTVI